MQQGRRPSPKLFSDFNNLQFAGVMGMVLFVMLLVLMTIPVYQRSVSVDLPKVSYPMSMPGALREDAIKVAVMRDGAVYFGADRVDPGSLPEKIADRMKDRGIERKVYISADMRAHWGHVETVLDAVRSAGILRVAIMVNQRAIRVSTR